MMRIVRRIIAALFLPVLLAVTITIGTVGAIVFTVTGHALLSRVASAWITRAFSGVVEIGAIGGNIWEHIVLEQVVIRDARGNLILSAPRIEAKLRPPRSLRSPPDIQPRPHRQHAPAPRALARGALELREGVSSR